MIFINFRLSFVVMRGYLNSFKYSKELPLYYHFGNL